MSYKFSDMIDYLVETYGKTREEVLAIYSPLSVRNKAELIKHTKLEMEDGRWVPLDKRECLFGGGHGRRAQLLQVTQGVCARGGRCAAGQLC